MTTCHFVKRANLPYLEEAVMNGYRMTIVLEYDGNFYYRVRVHEPNGTIMFLMYLNDETYTAIQQTLSCRMVKSVATGRFENAPEPCISLHAQKHFFYFQPLRMIVREFEINKGEWLSDVIKEIPTNTILNKTMTGCGATTLEINAARHSIIIEPNVPVIVGRESLSCGRA